jgi:RND superfamily putative drug exporter
VLGEPLPTGATAVMRRVAIAEADADATRSVGDVIAARLDATRPWYRLTPPRAAVDGWLERLAEARRDAQGAGESSAVVSHAAAPVRIDRDTALATLGAVDRALVALVGALAERPAAVVIDLDDETGADGARFWSAAARLTPAATTVIAGVAPGHDAAPFAPRGIRTIRLGAVLQETNR